MEKSKICPACNEEKDISKFYRNPDGSIRKHVCMACYGKKDRAKLKLEAIVNFGGSCQCCGEKHPYFLSLDHINNDGAQIREIYNEQQIYRLARREGWPVDKYQLLCMNCNFAKGHFGECPHKLGITPTQALTDLETRCFSGYQNVKRNTNNLPIARQKLAENRLTAKIDKTLGIINDLSDIERQKLLDALSKI